MNDQFSVSQTLIMQHFGADGKVKPIFQENKLCLWLISKGIVPWKIPGVFGSWQDKKEITVWQ